MKPYYEDNGITIYHGDCRELLPALGSFDVVMTDPVWPNCPVGLLPGSDRPFDLFTEMLSSLTSLPLRLVVVMRSDSDPRFLSAIPQALPFFRLQTLPYVTPGYIGRKLGGEESAYTFGLPIPSAIGQRVIPGRGPSAQPSKFGRVAHPTPRNLEHFLWLMRWWTMPGETLVDPFCGSGITLAAAYKFGIKATGIEIEEKYCEIAAQRLTQRVLAFD